MILEKNKAGTSFCRVRCWQQEALQSNMEQRSLHSHTGKDLWWNTTEIRDHNTHWCQRKSGWCAFSCHKCIDVRHRHSSPLSTEWLTLGFFVYFYFFKSFFVLFKKNVPVQETSRVTTGEVRAAHVGCLCFYMRGLEISKLLLFFVIFFSVRTTGGKPMLSFQGSEFMQATTTVSIQSIHEIK